MVDIASLGIRIDTSDIPRAVNELDKLEQAGTDVEVSAKGASKAWGSAGYAILNSAKGAAEGVKKIPAPAKEAAKAIQDVGVSAKQTQAALRNLPAQFTDIAVSLQGGMSPMSVLFQQGGQISDMFGGIGPALRETGKYALSLITPMTAAAAAVAAVAFAYKQGSDEITAYNNALILSGNYAGTTTASMEEMARRIDGVVGTQRAASQALAEIASTGRFSADQMERLARAAVAMEDATGKAVSETVAEFVKLADSPVAAVLELNRAQHFLTAEIYAQIDALEKAGDATGAAELALRSYADAMESRAGQVISSLGYIEKAWHAVKTGASEAWDEVLGIGRQTTDLDRLRDLQAELRGEGGRKTTQRAAVAAIPGIGGGINAAMDAMDAWKAFGRTQADIQRDIEATQKKIDDQKFLDDFLADVRRIDEAAIKSHNNLTKLGEAALTNAEKRSKALAQLEKDIEATRRVNPKSPLVAPERVQQMREKIERDFADPKEPEKRATRQAEQRDSAATRMLQTLREQGAVLESQADTTDRLTAAQRALIQFNQQVADLKEKRVLTADQKSLLAGEDAIRAQLEKNAAIESEIELRERAKKLEQQRVAFSSGLERENELAREHYQIQLDTMGLSQKQAQQQLERLRIEQQFSQRKTDVAAEFGRSDKTAVDDDIYASQTEALDKALQERLALHDEYYAQVAEKEGDWLGGAKAAMEDFRAATEDTYSATYSIVSDTVESLSEGFADAAAKSILWSEDFSEGMRNVGRSIIENVLSALIEVGTRYAVNATLEAMADTTTSTVKQANAVQTAAVQVGAINTVATASKVATVTNTGVQTAEAAKVTAAWTPASVVASIGSWGAAAAIGLAAVIAALAMAKGGFRKGGYTGDVGEGEVAGVVHGKEFVFDAAATRRIGVNNLEAMRSGKGAPQSGGSREWIAGGSDNVRVVNQTINVTTPNADSFRMSERQIKRRLRTGIA